MRSPVTVDLSSSLIFQWIVHIASKIKINVYNSKVVIKMQVCKTFFSCDSSQNTEKLSFLLAIIFSCRCLGNQISQSWPIATAGVRRLSYFYILSKNTRQNVIEFWCVTFVRTWLTILIHDPHELRRLFLRGAYFGHIVKMHLFC